MNEQNDRWAHAVQDIAGSFNYPSTPDIVATVRRRPPVAHRWQLRRFAPALAVLLIAVGLLLAVPRARAAVWEMIRAGAITIFVRETPPSAEPTMLPLETAVAEFAGLITLQDAQSQAGFPLLWPPRYGVPDQVYLQRVAEPGLNGQVVIMVWHDMTQPEQARLRLFQIDLPSYGLKEASIESVAQTEVNDQLAFWVEGGHRIRLQNGAGQESYFVSRNVLIWEERAITYRLESEMTLAEAILVAESLVSLEESE